MSTSTAESPNSGCTTLVMENFSQLPSNYKRSSKITFGKHCFVFRFRPNYKSVTFESKFVYVSWCNRSPPVTIVHFKVSILGVEGEKLYTNEFDSSNGQRVQRLISRAQLLDAQNHYLINDKLTLLCEVEVTETVCNQSDNFEVSVLTDGKLADATLIVGTDGRQFPVHTRVLSARSPVFAAMFEHDCLEKREAKVNITDMDGEVCEQMIRYIYTGSVDNLNKYAMDLLEAADKFQLDSLKSLCEQYISSNLTICTAAIVLAKADMYQANELKSKCIQYITDNSKLVHATDGWKLLDCKLLSELFLYASSRTIEVITEM